MNPDIIKRVADTVRAGTESAWDFAELYAALNAVPDFSYRELGRAVKTEYGIELPTPSLATRCRKAYETYVLKLGVPITTMKAYSPYTMYELALHVELDRKNVLHYLARAKEIGRDELLAEVRERDARPDYEHFRVEKGVAAMMAQARELLAEAAGYEPGTLSPTVFFEFCSELVINTEVKLLRSLWRKMHGDDEG
jgi:hypothetical protein